MWGDRSISILGYIQSEAVVGDDVGLLEAGNAFSNFEVDPVVRGKCTKVVMCDDIVRYGVEGKTNTLVAVYGNIIIEVIMSRTRNLERGVESMLFRRHLFVVRLAQCMAVTPG